MKKILPERRGMRRVRERLGQFPGPVTNTPVRDLRTVSHRSNDPFP